MKKIITGFAAIVFSSSLLANLSYTHVDVSYRTVDTDGDDVSGIRLLGSTALFSDSFFIYGGYYKFIDVCADVTTVNFGLGGNTPLSDLTDLVIGFEIIDSEGGENANQFALSIGVRSKIYNTVELGASVAHVETLGFTEDTTSAIFSIEALFDISETIQFNAGFSSGDADTLDFGMRFKL